MKIEHIAVWTKELENLKTFYCRYFCAEAGIKYINKKNNFQSYFLTFPDGARLELMYNPEIPDNIQKPEQYTGLIHFAFSVGSRQKVIELTDLLKTDGYKIISEPRNTGDGYFESCILDPDGNRIEITI